MNTTSNQVTFKGSIDLLDSIGKFIELIELLELAALIKN